MAWQYSVDLIHLQNCFGGFSNGLIIRFLIRWANSTLHLIGRERTLIGINLKPRLSNMKIFMSKNSGAHTYISASGLVENFMLTTPSCESKAPKDWDKLGLFQILFRKKIKIESRKYFMISRKNLKPSNEFEWNTFIYYKKYDDDMRTKVEASQFCKTKGTVQYLRWS